MKSFIVLDIESPNSWISSVSAIGILVIKDNEVIDSIYSLINPEEDFEDDIIDLTGITPDMVKDAPKFNEFWPEISDLLTKYPIIGHNIVYDLTVISRTLKRYGLNTPRFDYYCTLKLSKKRIDTYSHALTSLMYGLNYNYDAHNALEDAKATWYLFKHLDKIKKITIMDENKFLLREKKKEVNEEIIPSINRLYGMTQLLLHKKEVNYNHYNLLNKWIDNNLEFMHYEDISKIIFKLKTLLNDTENNPKNEFSKITSFYSKSEKYSSTELNSQVLKGLLEMINCDEKISQDEYDFMKKWISYFDLPANIDKDEILTRLSYKL